MLKHLMQLLGEEAGTFRRYLWMATLYGVLCGLATALLLPVFQHLLAGDMQGLLPWLGLLLAAVLVCWAWRRQVEHAGIRVGVAILRGTRHRLGAHVARLPVGWFDAANSARLGHVVTQGMMSVAQLPAHVLTPVIAGIVTPLVLGIALFAIEPALATVALLAVPALLAVFAACGRLSRRADTAFHRHFADASQRMIEFAQAQSVLRAFSGEATSLRFLQASFDRQQRSGLRLIVLSSLSAVLGSWAVQAVFAGLVLLAVFRIGGGLHGPFDPAQSIGLSVALLLVTRFIDPLQELAGYSEVLRSARGQLDTVAGIFAQAPLPQPLQPRRPADSSIQLRGVGFGYSADAPDTLQQIDLDVPAGSMLALVGASGSGKTTLVRLIARFFDVRRGRVMIGGVDVREIAETELAAQVSQVFQDSYLFAGSIADNIRMGRPAASDAQLAEAVRLAGVEDIAARLPDGLATPVGEGGAQLSGGERQRIAIARALIKDAPILLVDEATAALDAGNQAVIAAALAQLRGKRTLVVIAHQLSTVENADQIAVLADGRIVEYGPPARLRAAGGAYARFLEQARNARGWRIDTAGPAPSAEP
ncbi:ABC transporter ATP-binding protein [Stenotrophomonas mori]|uniref:ABC transporter ATP-binding protein/permease n=1 Tax=Stenotrophomonas mori TaxID=2871096 RepID=A0ABT0SFN9_9GAMM|nr:ABC transporter ATP-binding protein [Stenotrophomonas mori]MCL7713824.1 ABC transporter ATP-binding protein/permease [Stenotrophomonas mori]